MGYPYQTNPYQHGSALSRSFLPLALITLGVVFLLGNLVPQHARGARERCDGCGSFAGSG